MSVRLLLLSLLALLAACGQKGPLYLPDKNTKVITRPAPPPQPPPAPAASPDGSAASPNGSAASPNGSAASPDGSAAQQGQKPPDKNDDVEAPK
jgi:predicted small lipoprotein YifL